LLSFLTTLISCSMLMLQVQRATFADMLLLSWWWWRRRWSSERKRIGMNGNKMEPWRSFYFFYTGRKLSPKACWCCMGTRDEGRPFYPA
jgi:hypothetical protein